ncbi:hypothetical protein AAIR98_000555 [Elusimicrobium simillimum]|uniref:hypothetical protein n=1 Tax=Elusimicrobium simillimum TaxID=3143438 RepID=UPI003C6EAC2B
MYKTKIMALVLSCLMLMSSVSYAGDGVMTAKQYVNRAKADKEVVFDKYGKYIQTAGYTDSPIFWVWVGGIALIAFPWWVDIVGYPIELAFRGAYAGKDAVKRKMDLSKARKNKILKEFQEYIKTNTHADLAPLVKITNPEELTVALEKWELEKNINTVSKSANNSRAAAGELKALAEEIKNAKTSLPKDYYLRKSKIYTNLGANEFVPLKGVEKLNLIRIEEELLLTGKDFSTKNMLKTWARTSEMSEFYGVVKNYKAKMPVAAGRKVSYLKRFAAVAVLVVVADSYLSELQAKNNALAKIYETPGLAVYADDATLAEVDKTPLVLGKVALMSDAMHYLANTPYEEGIAFLEAGEENATQKAKTIDFSAKKSSSEVRKKIQSKYGKVGR